MSNAFTNIRQARQVSDFTLQVWQERALRLRRKVEDAELLNHQLYRQISDVESSFSWKCTSFFRQMEQRITRVVRCRSNPNSSGNSAGFGWIGGIEIAKKPGLILADVSMTIRGQMSPGMRRVTKGLVDACLRQGLPLVPIDLLSEPPNNAASFFDGGKNGSLAPEWKGEIFMLLDASWDYLVELRPFLDKCRGAGVRVGVLVCDTIPLDYPDLCSAGIVEGFTAWFDEVLARADDIICISSNTATRVKYHLWRRRSDRAENVCVHEWLPADELPPSLETTSDPLPSGPFVLSVGTVEPRKNYPFLLEAMSQMWTENDSNVRLVIVGSAGWNMDDFVAEMQHHQEWGRRLWWFPHATDVHLRSLYEACSAVVVPSIDEGLSLPLSEASAFGKPVVLSDIPVFRERLMSGGILFRLGDMGSLRAALRTSLAPGAPPCVVRRVSWRESARDFCRLLKVPIRS